MDVPRNYILNEVSQIEKDKYQMMSLMCGILKKYYKGTYLQNRNRLTENKLTAVRRETGMEAGEDPTIQHKELYSVSYNKL